MKIITNYFIELEESRCVQVTQRLFSMCQVRIMGKCVSEYCNVLPVAGYGSTKSSCILLEHCLGQGVENVQ